MPRRVLRVDEDVVPELRLAVRLELRQVEVRPAARVDELLRVVEEVQPEVDERARRVHVAPGAVVEPDVLLDEVPAARAHHDRRGLRCGDAVLLALGARVLEVAAQEVEQRQLALDDVPPGGARGVLLVGEPHLRAGVQRVDGHLAVGRAGDLDASVLEARRRAGDAPRRVVADPLGLGQELRVAAVRRVDAGLQAHGEQLVPGVGEAVVQLGEELERLGGEDLVVALAERRGDLDAGLDGAEAAGGGLGRLRVVRRESRSFGAGCRGIRSLERHAGRGVHGRVSFCAVE